MEELIEHNVLLYNRKCLEISGVLDVSEFSENTVDLTLVEGCLGIDGENLKIDYFSSESGKVSINGLISCITYYNKLSIGHKKKKR